MFEVKKKLTEYKANMQNKVSDKLEKYAEYFKEKIPSSGKRKGIALRLNYFSICKYRSTSTNPITYS